MLRTLVLGFMAGALAAALFFTGAWVILQKGPGWIQAAATPPWSFDPRVPPFGVPRFANLMFWGGVWGSVLGLAFARVEGALYWVGWILAGALALTFVGNFVVPLIKGQSMSQITNALSLPRFRNGLILNGAWGLGMAVLLAMLGRERR